MHHLAICTQAGECNGDVLVELDRHLEEKAQGSLTSDKEDEKEAALQEMAPEQKATEIAD